MAATASEDAEQSREQAAAALAGLKRTQKDEKKAKKYDSFLIDIISEILQNHVYDHIIAQIVPLLEKRISSNMLASVLILLKWSYIERARAFCEMEPRVYPDYRAPADPIEYSDDLDEALKSMINIWFETFGILLVYEVSQTELSRTQEIFDGEAKEQLVACVAHVFGHFLYDHKIHINNKRALRYARFIVDQMHKVVMKQEVDVFYQEVPDLVIEE